MRTVLELYRATGAVVSACASTGDRGAMLAADLCWSAQIFAHRNDVNGLFTNLTC